MLFSHHFDSSLGWIEIEFVVLLSTLTCFIVFLVIKFAVGLVVLWVIIKCVSSILPLRKSRSIRRLILKWRQRKAIFRRRIICLRLWANFISSLILCVVNITNIILHQNQMSILIWSLLCLPFFNSVIEKFNPFFVFFLKLSFNAFILNILQPIHLKTVLLILHFSIIFSNCLILNSWSITSSVLNSLIFLSFLTHLRKFDVAFIENYLLNIVSWHLSHEKTLCISILIPLNNFIFKTDKLQNLRKHAWFDWALLLKTFWH